LIFTTWNFFWKSAHFSGLIDPNFFFYRAADFFIFLLSYSDIFNTETFCSGEVMFQETVCYGAVKITINGSNILFNFVAEQNSAELRQ
jgi:hypothetical protein